MTPEDYWAYKAFVRDDVTEESLRSSEVFMAYRKAEMQREIDMNKFAELSKVNDKEKTLTDFEAFEKKVEASPKLKAKFKQIKAHLDSHPEVAVNVDPNFIAGINMLNLED